VWSGAGTLATGLIGWCWFNEPATSLKLASTGLIVLGVVGMHLASRATP